MSAGIVDASSRRVVATEVRFARGFWARMKGLMGGAVLREGQAFVLDPARSVHTAGMTYPIDVVLCARDGIVVHVTSMRPWRVGRFVRSAAFAIELPMGAAAAVGLGTRLVFVARLSGDVVYARHERPGGQEQPRP